jgi:hypothetical protein
MTRTESTTWYILAACAVGAVALIVFAMPSDASAATKMKRSGIASTTNLTCVQKAVTDRETTIGASYDKHFTAMKTALTDRKTALTAAWGKTDGKERRAAIKTAWKEFRADKSASHKTLSSERKAAWKTFRDTVKTECKQQVPAEDGESNDTIS